jgi:hypothetical protein
MAKKPLVKQAKSASQDASPLRKQNRSKPSEELDSLVHKLGEGIVCDTDRRGHATPQGRNPLDIVVDASEGFIPLWAENTILRWRFRERSMEYFEDPTAAKAYIRNLFAECLLKWGSAAPVAFTFDDDLWDFEIVMRSADQCNGIGCVLASAFFPDGGRHELALYPKMFEQTHDEQVDTFIHEIGHTFGLRHFFADVREAAFPSEIFGRHDQFSIMNYGELSELTSADKEDLATLYQLAWSGELTHINGTPIRLVRPFSSLAPVPDESSLAVMPAAIRPRATVPLRPRIVYPRSTAAYLDGK